MIFTSIKVSSFKIQLDIDGFMVQQQQQIDQHSTRANRSKSCSDCSDSYTLAEQQQQTESLATATMTDNSSSLCVSYNNPELFLDSAYTMATDAVDAGSKLLNGLGIFAPVEDPGGNDSNRTPVVKTSSDSTVPELMKFSIPPGEKVFNLLINFPL